MKKTKKEIRKQKQKDIQFIVSAVTLELYNIAYYEYFETWDTQGGDGWFFEECVDITHKIMLSEGSPYLNWLENWAESGGYKHCEEFRSFIEKEAKHSCFDWFHMDEARKEFESRYEKDEITTPIERKKVSLIIELLKKIEVDGEAMEHIITKVGMDEQMFRQLIKNEKKYTK